MSDPSKLYPYLITPAYVENLGPQPEGLVHPLGHGLSVTLVLEAAAHLVQNFTVQALASSGLSVREAHARAVENLVARFRAGDSHLPAL